MKLGNKIKEIAERVDVPIKLLAYVGNVNKSTVYSWLSDESPPKLESIIYWIISEELPFLFKQDLTDLLTHGRGLLRPEFGIDQLDVNGDGKTDWSDMLLLMARADEAKSQQVRHYSAAIAAGKITLETLLAIRHAIGVRFMLLHLQAALINHMAGQNHRRKCHNNGRRAVAAGGVK